MQVKDRFCTLLSQQVSQLQNRLASLNFETQDGEAAKPQQEVRERDQEREGWGGREKERKKEREREQRVFILS